MKHRIFEMMPNNPPLYIERHFDWTKIPSFEKDIWPYFIDNSSQITKIFLNRRGGSGINSKSTEIVEVFPEGYKQINGLSKLEEKIINKIRNEARLGFALDLLFYTEDFSFVKGLCNLFPWQGEIVDMELMRKRDEDNIHLKQFTDRFRDKGFLIAYSEETNLLAIWGDEDVFNKNKDICLIGQQMNPDEIREEIKNWASKYSESLDKVEEKQLKFCFKIRIIPQKESACKLVFILNNKGETFDVYIGRGMYFQNFPLKKDVVLDFCEAVRQGNVKEMLWINRFGNIFKNKGEIQLLNQTYYFSRNRTLFSWLSRKQPTTIQYESY